MKYTRDRPVYVISVAAELVDMHPQTLRMYERKGLIHPGRSGGKTRLYSERDIEHLREIRRLTQELGLNLAGVEEVLRLRLELDRLQLRLEGEINRLEGEISSSTETVVSPPLDPSKDRPVYVISVAAELVDMHPQTLRMYERKGLIRPGRSIGKTRRYSERDIEHLREIRRLTQELGINLAGVEEIMRLRHQLDEAQDRIEEEISRLHGELTNRIRAFQALPAPRDDRPADGETLDGVGVRRD